MRVSYSGARAPKPTDPPAWHGLHRRMLREVDADVDELPAGTVVVHGAEPTGVDMRAAKRAEARGLATEAHPADWKKHGRAAGMIRNRYVETVDRAKFFLAPWSVGTRGALELARRAGVPFDEHLYLPLTVMTAHLSHGDPARLDITRGGADKARATGKPAPGEFLAPSAALVYPAIEAMKIATFKVKEGASVAAAGKAAGDTLEVERGRDMMATGQTRLEATWDGYEPAYLAEMRHSYKTRRATWDALLEWRTLHAVCACTDPRHCHRWILRTKILAKMGCIDGGEVEAERKR